MKSTSNNKHTSAKHKEKDVHKQQQKQSKTPFKNNSRSPPKLRRLSSAGCTPPPPPIHLSSSDNHVVRHINQRNQRRHGDDEDIGERSTYEYRYGHARRMPRHSRRDDEDECDDESDIHVHGRHRGADHHQQQQQRPPTQYIATANIRRNFTPRRDRTSYYPFRVMGGLGIAQIFLGLLAASMQFVALFVREPTSFIGAGIWAGLFFVVAGTLAVVSTRRNRGRGRVSWSISVMIVSIFAILVALGMLAVASIGLHLTSNFQYDTEYPLSWKVLESLSVVIALVEGLVAFLTSIMACKGIALNCRAPPKIGSGAESTALYMLVPKNSAGDQLELPQSLEVRSLQVGADGHAIEGEGFCATLERRKNIDVIPPDPPQRGHSYSLSRPSSMHRHSNVPMDGDDFEPPPAYSERV